MNIIKSLLNSVVATLQANRLTIAIWTGLILVVVIGMSINHARSAAIERRLQSPDQSVRDQQVLDLARSGTLGDTLASTEDPGSDVTSAQNVQSATLREAAALSLNRVLNQLSMDDGFNALYQLRKDTDAGVAATATTGLATLIKKGNADLHDVVGHLGDGDPDIRSASVDSLALVGGSTTAATVAKVINDPASQDSALATLTKIGKPALPFLTQVLNDTSQDIAFRQDVVTDLGAIGDPAAIPALASIVNQQPPVPALRRVSQISIATIVLATIPPPLTSQKLAAPATTASAGDIASAKSASPLLIANLNNSNDDSAARARSALALGRIASPQAIQSLTNALGDLDSAVASSALVGAESAGPAAVPSLSNSLKSGSETMQVAAASALGVIGNAEALSALQPAFASKSALVRRAAADALGRSENPAAVPLLIPCLNDNDGFVASAASSSLTFLGAAARPALVQALGASGPTEPYYASRALLAEGPSIIPALSQASLSGSNQQKVWVAVTLGQLHDPSAKPVLEQLASNSNAQLKWVASQALQQYSAG